MYLRVFRGRNKTLNTYLSAKQRLTFYTVEDVKAGAEIAHLIGGLAGIL